MRWQGYVDTDLDVSEFYTQDHTIMVSFMAQYEASYEGPLVASTGSGWFVIGLGDFDNLIPNVEQIEVDYNGSRGLYLLPNPVRWPVSIAGTTEAPPLPNARWHHLAVVKAGSFVTVYIDGQRSCTYPPGLFCDLPLLTGPPTGTVRFGKRPVGSNQRQTQFYGFMDDVAVFLRALSQSEVQAIVASPRLHGTEDGLYAGYVFDAVGPLTPSTLRRPYTVVSPAELTVVSANRSNAFDTLLLPSPVHTTTFNSFTFNRDVWEVFQGPNNPDPDGSHNGFAAFAWDLMFVPYPDVVVGQPFFDQSQTIGKFVLSVAAGTVASLEVSNPDGGPDSNSLSIEHAPGEFSSYLHFQQNGTLPELGDAVFSGQLLGFAGNTGAPPHLHFAVTDFQEPCCVPGADSLVTFPAALSDYWASDDYGRTWYHVNRGMLRAGQWITRVQPE